MGVFLCQKEYMLGQNREAPNMIGANIESGGVRRSSGELPQRPADPNRYSQKEWQERVEYQANRIAWELLNPNTPLYTNKE
jgi:hypothetical protein